MSIITFHLEFPIIHVLVYRSVLCNYCIEAENIFLFESLAACHDTDSKLMMHFTLITAFVNYLESLDYKTYSLKAPILLNRTTYKQTLPISLSPPEFDSKLQTAPKTLKDFVHHIQKKKNVFNLQERHTDMELKSPSKNLFFNYFV